MVAVDERGLVRQGFENRLVTEMRSLGQGSITTFNLLGLPEIKADKEAAATQLRAAGADAVFVVRLVDQVTYEHQVQATPALYLPTIDGYAGYGWYDCYSVAFMNMGVVWSHTTREIYLDSSLFDLKTGKRLWSAVTKTALKEDADRLALWMPWWRRLETRCARTASLLIDNSQDDSTFNAEAPGVLLGVVFRF